MTSQSSWFEKAVTALTDTRDQRVWSIIVSLFGDLAQDPGAQISGGALTRVIEPMGIKPEAVRVALHRLRKDGWIESDRVGRVSHHYLTEFGRAQSAAVTPRIYARTGNDSQNWHLLIAEDGVGTQLLDDVLLSREYASIGRNIALGSGPAPDLDDALLSVTITALHAPKWLQDRLCPKDLCLACQALLEAVQTASKSRPPKHALSPSQTATLRILLVHRWRRIVLRQPDLPDGFFPPDWVGPECRAAVFNLLDTLDHPSPDLLNSTE